MLHLIEDDLAAICLGLAAGLIVGFGLVASHFAPAMLAAIGEFAL